MAATNNRPTKAKPRGRPFAKGVAANPRGRPKGSRNKRTLEGVAFFRDVLQSPAWQASAARRMIAGDAPHLEKYGLELTWGKPREVHDLHVEHSSEGDWAQRLAAKLNAIAAAHDAPDPPRALTAKPRPEPPPRPPHFA